MFAPSYADRSDEPSKSAPKDPHGLKRQNVHDHIRCRAINIPVRQLLYIAIVLFVLFMGLGTLLFGSVVVGALIGVIALFSPSGLACSHSLVTSTTSTTT